MACGGHDKSGRPSCREVARGRVRGAPNSSSRRSCSWGRLVVVGRARWQGGWRTRVLKKCGWAGQKRAGAVGRWGRGRWGVGKVQEEWFYYEWVVVDL